MKCSNERNQKMRIQEECEPGAKSSAGDWMRKLQGEWGIKADINEKNYESVKWKRRKREQEKKEEGKGRTMECPQPCLYRCWQFRATRWEGGGALGSAMARPRNLIVCALLCFALLCFSLASIVASFIYPVLRCVVLLCSIATLFFTVVFFCSIVLSLQEIV